ncbi:MAG: hypothetical protein MJZ41_04030 [Bacteroidaceae bacterium]|nr:hypothetical protein [Bacteroidaceae bacterium]
MRNINELGVSVRVKKDLPYTPYPDEIIFVDGAHTIKVERWRIDYYKDFISGLLNVPEGYAESYGTLIIEMLKRPEFWEFFSDEERHDIESELVDKFNFRQYLLPQVLADNLRPSIFIYDDEDTSGYHRFIQFEVDRHGLLSTLNDVLLYMDSRDKTAALSYERESAIEAERNDVIAELRQKVMQLEAYIREYESKLMKMGMNRNDIKVAVCTDSDEMGLYISKRGKFFITKNGNPTEQEIRLSPLDKAVYMLFLRHPEGINFSFLPDYREELMEIYRSLMNYRTTASMQKSIDDVTDPTNNSINEKCARIRRAFISALGQYKASAFFIAGPRGGAKKIALERRLVCQEQ